MPEAMRLGAARAFAGLVDAEVSDGT